MYTPAYRCSRGERVRKVTKLLVFGLLGLVIAGRAMGQADSKPSPSPPDATEMTGSASKDTVIPARETVVQQKATANPMKLSNPANVQVKQIKTPEQKESDKSRKQYEKHQRKEQKKAEKEQHKRMHDSAKAHSSVH